MNETKREKILEKKKAPNKRYKNKSRQGSKRFSLANIKGASQKRGHKTKHKNQMRQMSRVFVYRV